MGAQASTPAGEESDGPTDFLGCSAARTSEWAPESLCSPDRKNEDKLSKGLESNFMPFEADGRYNRVFDMAEEGIEVSDVELATRFTHRMDKQRSPRERRARASLSASPLASPTRGVPRGGTLVAGVNLGPDPNTYTQGPEIGLAFTPTNVSLNASKLTKRKGEQFGSPSGTLDGVTKEMVSLSLGSDKETGSDGPDVFLKRTPEEKTQGESENKRDEALSSLFHSYGAADDFSDENTVSDSAGSRSPTRLASPRELKTHPNNNAKMIHDPWTKHMWLTGTQRMMDHRAQEAAAKAEKHSVTIRKQQAGLLKEATSMKFK